MSNEIILAIVGGIVTITVAMIGILPKLKELKKSEKDKHDELVEIRNSIGEEIEHLLENYRNKVGACRAYVFEYHNGVTSFVGLPFLKMSNTYEVVEKGAQPQQAKLLDMSCFLYAKFVRSIDLSDYIVLDLKNRNESIGNLVYETLAEQDISISVIARMTNSKNQSTGFVGVDFCNNNKNYRKEIVPVVQELAVKISTLLNLY